MDNSRLIWAVSDVPPSLSYSASLGRLSPSVYQHMQKRKHVHLSVRTRPCWSFYETWQLHSGTCCQGIHLLLIAANLTQSIVLLILQSIHQHYITHTTHSYFTWMSAFQFNLPLEQQKCNISRPTTKMTAISWSHNQICTQYHVCHWGWCWGGFLIKCYCSLLLSAYLTVYCM